MKPRPFTGSKHFDIKRLAEGVYAAIAIDGGAAISNAGIINLGGQTIVFDTFLTPQAARDLRSFAESEIGRPPNIVVNSHYHNDHIWGNQSFLPEAQIIASAITRELVATAGAEELQWYSANSAQRLESLQSQFRSSQDEQQRRQFSMWIGYYAGLVEALPGLTVCMPGITFHDRLEIHGSKLNAALISYEGAHTQSDTVLYLPVQGIIFMSDLLFIGCHPYLADGDPEQLLKTVKELSQMDAQCFIPGHGPVGTRDDLGLLIEYIESCLATAQELAAIGDYEGKIQELKVPDAYHHWQLAQFYPANIRFLCQRNKT